MILCDHRKKDLFQNAFPADAGCVVDNVQTVLAVYDAVCKCAPSMQPSAIDVA